MTKCSICGVTIEWREWPQEKRRPAWLGTRAGYWLDPWRQRGGYEAGKPRFGGYYHEHTPE